MTLFRLVKKRLFSIDTQRGTGCGCGESITAIVVEALLNRRIFVMSVRATDLHCCGGIKGARAFLLPPPLLHPSFVDNQKILFAKILYRLIPYC